MFRKDAGISLFLALALVGVTLGFHPTHVAAQQAPAKTPLLYFIPHSGAGDPFWATQKAGWETASGLLPMRGVFAGPPKFDPKEQAEMVGAAVAAAADGIAVTMAAPQMVKGSLSLARSRGIPVLIINSRQYGARPEELIPSIGFIGQDEDLTGKALAERVLKEFKPKRAVFGIHHAGHIVHELRARGIMGVLSAHNIPIEKLDITQEPSRGVGILDSYLKRYPDTDMIFTSGPLGTAASVRLVREKNLQGKVRLATMDVDKLTLEAIEKGEMIATIAQQPFMQGYLGAVALYLHVQYGFMLPPQINTGPTVIDKSNMSLVDKQVKTTGGS